MKTIINKILAVGFAMLAIAFVFSSSISTTMGSAPTGLATSIATTSNPTVGTTAVTLFATTTACNSRVITTYAQPIMLTFSDYAGQTPTGTFGHLQAASTTVVYDSGQYGCDLVKVYAFDTVAITVSESR